MSKMLQGTFQVENNTYSCYHTNLSMVFMKERSHMNVKFVTKQVRKCVFIVLDVHTQRQTLLLVPRENLELIDTPYACAIYLVTTLDLVTVFQETKSVTKSRFHCIFLDTNLYSILVDNIWLFTNQDEHFGGIFTTNIATFRPKVRR